MSEDAEDASHSGHAQQHQDSATGSSGNNVNNSTNTGDAYVDEVLCQLQQQQQHGQPVGTEANSGRNTGFLGENISWQDPRIYIKPLANTQDNYQDIVDFVRHKF